MAEFFNEGIQKLIHWYDKCLNVAGNDVEKLLKDLALIYNLKKSLMCYCFLTTTTFWMALKSLSIADERFCEFSRMNRHNF